MNNSFVHVLSYWFRRIGWPVVVGIALIGVAVSVFIGANMPAERRLTDLERQIATGDHQPVLMRQAPQVALQGFYHILPSEKSIPDLLEKIFDAAYENNVDPEQGQFKLLREPDARFSQYQIVLPVTASYVDLRRFVNRVLQEIPAIALDGIGFSRENSKAEEVQANVRFTLYLGVKQ